MTVVAEAGLVAHGAHSLVLVCLCLVGLQPDGRMVEVAEVQLLASRLVTIGTHFRLLVEIGPSLPEQLVGDGTGPIPPLFYPMLNKYLALLLLPEWAGYLWGNGRERSLITMLDEGEGQVYAAWRVLPTGMEWHGSADRNGVV